MRRWYQPYPTIIYCWHRAEFVIIQPDWISVPWHLLLQEATIWFGGATNSTKINRGVSPEMPTTSIFKPSPEWITYPYCGLVHNQRRNKTFSFHCFHPILTYQQWHFSQASLPSDLETAPSPSSSASTPHPPWLLFLLLYSPANHYHSSYHRPLSQNTPTTGAKNTIVGAPSQKTRATGQKNTDQHNRLEIPWLLSQKTPVPAFFMAHLVSVCIIHPDWEAPAGLGRRRTNHLQLPASFHYCKHRMRVPKTHDTWCHIINITIYLVLFLIRIRPLEKSKPIIIKITLSPLICWSASVRFITINHPRQNDHFSIESYGFSSGAPTHCRRLRDYGGPGTMTSLKGWVWSAGYGEWEPSIPWFISIYTRFIMVYQGLPSVFFLGSCHFEGKACVYYHIYDIIYIYMVCLKYYILYYFIFNIYIYMCVSILKFIC